MQSTNSERGCTSEDHRKSAACCGRVACHGALRSDKESMNSIAGCKMPRFLFTMHKEKALFVPLRRGAVALSPPLDTLAL